jgi:hypothetical protein
MRRKPSKSIYQTAENLSLKWWLYFILFLCVFIPPYSSQGFSSFGELVDVVQYVANFLILKKLALVPYMPWIHLAYLLLFVALIKFGNRFGRIFSVVAGLHYILITFLQAGANTDKYGLVLYPNAILLISLFTLGWFWDAVIRKTNYKFTGKAPAYYWFAAIVAFFSFWNPDKIGYLSPASLITSTSPIAFCMITPIYLGALSTLYPDINLPMFRITSFVGILISIITIGMGFFMENQLEGIYWSVLHLPMLFTSVYCFLLGFQNPETIQRNKSSNFNQN